MWYDILVFSHSLWALHPLTLSTVPGLSRSSSLHSTAPSCRDAWRKASGSEMLFLGDSRTPSVMSHVTVCSAEFMPGCLMSQNSSSSSSSLEYLDILLVVRPASDRRVSPASSEHHNQPTLVGSYRKRETLRWGWELNHFLPLCPALSLFLSLPLSGCWHHLCLCTKCQRY